MCVCVYYTAPAVSVRSKTFITYERKRTRNKIYQFRVFEFVFTGLGRFEGLKGWEKLPALFLRMISSARILHARSGNNRMYAVIDIITPFTRAYIIHNGRYLLDLFAKRVCSNSAVLPETDRPRTRPAGSYVQIRARRGEGGEDRDEINMIIITRQYAS